jgi:hypothetical protein
MVEFMKRIDYLLKKYKHPYTVPGVHETSEDQKHRKQHERLKKRYEILDDIILKAPEFNLSKYEITRIKYLIKQYNKHFRKLNTNCSDKCIILSFIFSVILVTRPNSRININKWSISKEYKLTPRKFYIIINNMFHMLLKKQPLPPHQTTKYDHNILEKQ